MTLRSCQRLLALLLVSILIISFHSALIAQENSLTERDAAFEQEIYDRLAAINPDAVDLFIQATQQMDSGQFTQAQATYHEVLDLAPDFPDALRRLSYVELELGNTADAITYAQQAVDVDSNLENRAALALAQSYSANLMDHQAALRGANAVVAEAPDDAYYQFVLIMAGISAKNVAAIEDGAAALMRLEPNDPVGYYYAGVVAADDGDWDRAETLLNQAQDRGLPAEEVQAVLDERPNEGLDVMGWVGKIGIVIGIWAVGLVTLFGLGIVLSRRTMAAVQTVPGHEAYNITAGERNMRRLYRFVIMLTSLYFYLSIPIVILMVLGLAGGIFYLFVQIGRIPRNVAGFLFMFVIYTLYAVGRSLIAQSRHEDPEFSLDRKLAPDLWKETDAVANRLNTRPIDRIFVLPGTSIGVTEQGGIFSTLLNRGRRDLYLGLGALHGLSRGQFRAILAHEYGHFSNRDTAGGDLSLQIRVSMGEMARHLMMRGLAAWYNPAWIFLNFFNRVFLIVTQGASRLQEVLADRYAAIAYGSQNLVNGLKHVITQSITFDYQTHVEIQDAFSNQRALQNLYVLPELDGDIKTEWETMVQAAMNRPSSIYDSHPSYVERVHLLEQIKSSFDPAPDDDADVWSLLPECDKLQDQMTQMVSRQVQYQIQVAAAQRQAQQQQ